MQTQISMRTAPILSSFLHIPRNEFCTNACKGNRFKIKNGLLQEYILWPRFPWFLSSINSLFPQLSNQQEISRISGTLSLRFYGIGGHTQRFGGCWNVLYTFAFREQQLFSCDSISFNRFHLTMMVLFSKTFDNNYSFLMSIYRLLTCFQNRMFPV